MAQGGLSQAASGSIRAEVEWKILDGQALHERLNIFQSRNLPGQLARRTSVYLPSGRAGDIGGEEVGVGNYAEG